jgi:hypothetical protein
MRGFYKEWTMRRLREHTARSRTGRGLKTAAAALLVVIAFGSPNIAYAGPHGGGGSHGGGGKFHGSMVRGVAIPGGFPVSHNGFHGGHGGGRLIYMPGAYGSYPADAYGGGYDDGGYDDSGQPSPSQVWYYCADPAGYYPYVTQCSTDWQMVPG